MNKSGRFRARALNSDEIAGFLSKNAFRQLGCGMNFLCTESELTVSLSYCVILRDSSQLHSFSRLYEPSRKIQSRPDTRFKVLVQTLEVLGTLRYWPG